MSQIHPKSISLRQALLKRMVAAALLPPAIAILVIALTHGRLSGSGEISLMLSGLFVGLVFSVYLGFETHRKVTQTIDELKIRLSSISLGNFQTEPSVPGSPDFKEYTELLLEITRMADALSARERDIIEARREFEILFNSSSDAVFIIEALASEDTVGRFIQVNERACLLTEMRRSELIGREFFETIADGGTLDLETHIKKLFQSGQHLFEAVVSKEKTPIEINARIFHYKGQRQVIASARNITIRKRTEAALLQAKEIAEEANLSKSEFLSVMSHEIRTPLGAVIGFSEILEMETGRKDHKAYIHSILENAHSLVRLIDDILAYGRLSSNRLTIAPATTDIKQFYTDLCAYSELKVSQSKKPFKFSSSYDPAIPKTLITDRGRLQQVITNLINNAIKYSDEGTVHLAFELQPVDGTNGTLSISVQDEGPGISAENLDRIWKPFEQLGTRNDTGGGVGLGLAICKRLVELIGGSIFCESVEGQGSRFWVELEVLIQSQENGGEPLSTFDFTIESPAPKIICAEDNAANRAILRVLLKKLKQNCIFVENGKELLAQLKKETFDLILLDLNMPLMDGFEATRRIREGETGEEHKNIFISALTASASDESRQNCFQAGMNFFMTKPFTTKMLVEIIQKYQKTLN